MTKLTPTTTAHAAAETRPRSCEPAAAGATSQASNGCCGGPARQDTTACCVADEAAKAEGKAGCGCTTDRTNQ